MVCKITGPCPVSDILIYQSKILNKSITYGISFLKASSSVLKDRTGFDNANVVSGFPVG